MKWFFALSEASLSSDELYANCIRAAVTSARERTTLVPHFLYDGGENPFLEELRSQGVEIIRHRSVLYDHIVEDRPDDKHFIRIASGAFLRMDLPLIEHDAEYVLYTDCDVMFLRNPELGHSRPTFFSAAPEFKQGDYGNMNSGVMFINVPNMRAIHDELIQYVRESKISSFGSYDQRVFRTFFRDRYDRLPETLNWKPYWGINEGAEIIHFHGPKPPHVRALLNGTGDQLPETIKALYYQAPPYYNELTIAWHALLPSKTARTQPAAEFRNNRIPGDNERARERFERRAPSAQNAVDIFPGRWASDLGKVCGVTGAGSASVFSDARVKMAADALGRGGQFDGKRILELGPLEGAHTYQLEQLGAERVIAVESNTEAYLKCLVVKELLGLKNCRFLCGDAVAYLEETTEHFDLIFCSGVLYHMADPVGLIKLICERASSSFVWTHYQSDEAIKKNVRQPRPIVSDGFEATYYEHAYPDINNGRFWGGNTPVAAWMTQGHIVGAFRHFGFGSSIILQDHPDHPNGGAFSLAAWR